MKQCWDQPCLRSTLLAVSTITVELVIQVIFAKKPLWWVDRDEHLSDTKRRSPSDFSFSHIAKLAVDAWGIKAIEARYTSRAIEPLIA